MIDMAEPDGADDDSLLERIDDVIDTALGEDLPPPEEKDPWERRERLLDSWTAVLMGIAALLTAWTSYQSAQWADVQTEALESASTSRTNAARLAAEASRSELVDAEVWLAWYSAYGAKRERAADFLQERFSPQLARAQAAWLNGVRFDPDGDPETVPSGTPFDVADYTVPERALEAEELARADTLIDEAVTASETNSSFVVIVVLLALSLFFLGIATKLGRPKVQVAMIAIGAALMILSSIRIIALPHAF
jgi:hypothetical protein